EADGEGATPDLDAALDDDIGDDLLRLVFTACHPVLATEARVALTLRLIGGLTTDEIARAFLAPEPTIAQRIVRAKRTLTDKRVPFEVPRGAELAKRVASVLEVIDLMFNEGKTASKTLTHERVQGTRRTGSSSGSVTGRWPNSGRRRSWSSIARWRRRSCSVRRRDWS